MIEDVTTSGKSMEETVPKVKGAADVEIVGLMVSLNRMEVGKGGEKCALDEVRATLNQEVIDTNIVKTTYYDNKEDATAWKETDVGGYVFLSGE